MRASACMPPRALAQSCQVGVACYGHYA